MDSADTGNALPIPPRYLARAERPDAQADLQTRLPAKLKTLADSRLVRLAREAYGYTRHPAISRRHKVAGVAALLYLVAPFDAVSDWIPGLGYVDDAAVLTAFVMSVREAAKQVVSHTQQAAAEVVSQAVSEAREAWAKRGVSQVVLSLWGATVAACVGLLYAASRATFEGGGAPEADPFFWACILSGALGLGYHLLFAHRVWKRYASSPPEIKEPLAHALVSLADWRQIVALTLPVAVLAAALLLRVALDGSG